MHSIMHVYCIVQCKKQYNSLHKRLTFDNDEKLGVILICRALAADEHWAFNLTEIGIRCTQINRDSVTHTLNTDV